MLSANSVEGFVGFLNGLEDCRPKKVSSLFSLVEECLVPLQSAREKGYSYRELSLFFAEEIGVSITEGTLKAYLCRCRALRSGSESKKRRKKCPSLGGRQSVQGAKKTEIGQMKDSQGVRQSPSQELRGTRFEEVTAKPPRLKDGSTNPLLTVKRTDYPELYADYEDTNP